MLHIPRHQSGFTIVELLIVVVVIAVLAAITVVGFTGIQSQARDSHLSSDINAIKKAMEMYRSEVGEYPPCPGGVTECMYMSSIRDQLVPKYVSGLSTYNFNYVRYPDSSRWGMRYFADNEPYKISTTCKFGLNMISTWYSSAPECK